VQHRVLSAESLEAIEDLAKSATPGPWMPDGEDFWTVQGGTNMGLVAQIGNPAYPSAKDEPNARFIAALDPTTVLGLLEEVKRARIVVLAKEKVDAAVANAAELIRARDSVARLTAERDRLVALLNTPEILDFAKAVQIEAAHQRERWGSEHDAGKTNEDWFWLIGYLAGKALRDSTPEKRMHRVVTVAAAACNWHAALLGKTNMRPGIGPAAAAAIDGEVLRGE
jgi:hypothetical protein